MKGEGMEIGKDFYCSANVYIDEECFLYEDRRYCDYYHRKHPTPEQFKEEYCEEWKGAVYVLINGSKSSYWSLDEYDRYLEEMGGVAEHLIICACTPFGKPNDDWRPE
jgi:hypothetical protein